MLLGSNFAVHLERSMGLYQIIQYLTPLLLIYCCLLDHAREGIIFTVDYNILLEEVLILNSCWYSLALEGPVRIACLQCTYASQPVSVLKQRYSHQMPFEMHCLGEIHHTRSHVSNTTQTVTNVPILVPNWELGCCVAANIKHLTV